MVYVILVLLAFIADVVIKEVIDQKWPEKKEKKICKDHFVIKKYYNTGAALNFCKKRPKLLLRIHAVMLAVIAALFCREVAVGDKKHHLPKVGLALALGGGASNFFDRISKGHVVDYISVNTKCKRIRSLVFNLSDLFVAAGTVMWIFSRRKR